MNHLLLGSLLVISLNAEKCNQERTDGGVTEDRSEQPRMEQGEPNDLYTGEHGSQLEGPRWYIVSLEDADLGLPEGAERPYIELNSEQLQGFGGCNNLMGSYKIKEQSIHFADVGSTKKYCPELQAVERSVLEMLAEVNGYQVENDTLLLLQGTRHLALLRTLAK